MEKRTLRRWLLIGLVLAALLTTAGSSSAAWCIEPVRGMYVCPL